MSDYIKYGYCLDAWIIFKIWQCLQECVFEIKIRKKHVKCVKLDNSENLKLYSIYRKFKALLKAYTSLLEYMFVSILSFSCCLWFTKHEKHEPSEMMF